MLDICIVLVVGGHRIGRRYRLGRQEKYKSVLKHNFEMSNYHPSEFLNLFIFYIMYIFLYTSLDTFVNKVRRGPHFFFI